MGRGLLGSMFDFNRDGELNAFERAAECQFFNEVLMKDDTDCDSDNDYDSDDAEYD